MNQSITVLESRPATEEELYYLKLAREEFGASLVRIEEAAKFLIGAAGTVAGLFITGQQIRTAIQPQPMAASTAPFVFLSISLLAAIFVLLPMPYRHYRNAPAAIQRAFSKARWLKWGLLLFSALAFIAGLISAVLQF